MKTDELREKYLAFFESKGCTRCPSDVLVPAWDHSVLFTPAGMNQFKDHFLGKVKLDFTSATTCQKCLRTGDIDNVGRTAFHHTFFEMLGNFSFGDYFKEEAIHWAWEFLTDKKWLGIPGDRLSVTVYKDDDEAHSIWHEKIKLPESRINRMDEDENFWPASAPSEGPDGVCGPCSEIYYHLEDGSDVEIWNLVFTQFNRTGNPPDNLLPLPSKNIDTGMGLERTASVLQGVPTNFHIDSLFPIVEAAADVCGVKYVYDSDNGRRLRRITDHARASAFTIHENVYPGAKDARYVIRRLIRRAVLDGYQMKLREPFLYKLVEAVANASKAAYPELSQTTTRVAEAIEAEEKAFFDTIDGGMKRIEKLFTHMKSESQAMVPGDDAADLQKTYGVPPELVQTLAAEQNFTFDWEGYRKSMDQHSIDSGAGQVALFQTGPLETLKESLRETPFIGYEHTSAKAIVKGIITGDDDKDDDGQLLSHLDRPSDNPMRIVLDHSPFYGESGGQVGDCGVIENDDFTFEVRDTQRHASLIVHHGRLVRGAIHEGDQCEAKVDVENRTALARAHSATHILHHALHHHVGRHAEQQGSKVEADRLRFDFTNPKAIPDDILAKIETDVLAKVSDAEPIRWDTVSLAEAREAGAMMLFGEKYPDPCRMVSMGTFSRELCGGTHLTNTSQVQAFEVVVEESVSTGTRRIEALTGARAEEHRAQTRELLSLVASKLGCQPGQALDALVALTDDVKTLKKELSSGKAGKHSDTFQFKGGKSTTDTNDYQAVRTAVRAITRRLNVSIGDVGDRIDALLADREKLVGELKTASEGDKVSIDDLIASGETVDGTLVVVTEVSGGNPNLMRGWIDQIRKKSNGDSAVLLASVADGKVVLVGGLSHSLVERGLKAGEWVGAAAKAVGGGGGGRPDMAQAGGKDPAKLPAALEEAMASMKAKLTA
ncbi:alanine--tRNA ligase [Rubripirellula amarantea]|uniref:Alanine--tRNA ligase n=1 Tax=Rubripirellula amarantea TaxID=2527999 RepID=A0A5C5WVM9_9BACT|nr:alanine--tRNA ligase [Rubripirellula amarantea]MDA8744907.1 alanine--tRNA ligase [Rubripirellula amarantea]TWT54736.1 Alanine--tRNA ligase [Rubripirellula amarantea]